MQSQIDTPQTPQAMLMPDQGTTPIRRSTERRTQAEDRGLSFSSAPEGTGDASESPSSAWRVSSRAFGKKRVMRGPRGIARSVAHAEPTVVSAANKMVASPGENRAPPSTFCVLY